MKETDWEFFLNTTKKEDVISDLKKQYRGEYPDSQIFARFWAIESESDPTKKNSFAARLRELIGDELFDKITSTEPKT